jgi:mono/diheme cytochrome c family protein
MGMPPLATAMLLVLAADAPAPAKVDFRRDVYPLLKTACFDCHQGRRASSGVRLDLRADILGETTGKPLVVPGKSGQSRLIAMVTAKVPNKVMPKVGPRLSEDQVRLLAAWIDQGLPWNDGVLPPESLAGDHWAFQPVQRPAVPEIGNAAWVNNPVDAFILAKLEANGLQPAAPADARTLLRRMSLDLVGLPPDAEQVDAFVREVKGAKPQAVISTTVARLLSSPHYGERWGRHWLDVARWAESEGYESNHPRAFAWRYRDWVVRAFNDDKPFADFVREQLAGDEITPYADERLIGTGFLAAARLSSNEEDRPRQRNDILIDVVNATASALLGLTMQCAQCHSHKFDPISARDYYRFQGFFVRGQPGNLALRDPQLWRQYHANKPEDYDKLLAERDALYEAGRQRKIADVRKALTSETLAVYALTMQQRTPEQETLARQTDLLFQFATGQIEAAVPDKKRYAEVKKQVADLETRMSEKPQTFGYYSPATSPHEINVLPMKGFYPLIYAPQELKRAKPYLLAAGDVHQPSFPVDVGWPALFGPTKSAELGSRPRLALANWLADPRHPLAARVYVNRIWQQHFGRGIVASANDFGLKGEPPTHPELLDWLAAEFIDSGGSTKHLHRLVLTSNTYQQSSVASTETLAKDPDNLLWSRWQPRRLEAETIRDSLLAVSGELDARVGGPSSPDDKATRRSLYLFQKRDLPPQQQSLFDGPGAMTESCAQRLTTTVPLQALYLLNSKFSVERAKALAQRVVAAAGADRERQIEAVFRLALQRLPEPHERELARRFFTDENSPAALARFCQALMNVNEFVYLE